MSLSEFSGRLGWPLAILVALFLFAPNVEPAAAQCPPFPDACAAPANITCPADITGSFCDAQGPYLSGAGLPGIIANAGQVSIDQDCNGTVNDPADITIAEPAAIANIRSACPSCTVQWRLTPSQQFAYARVFSSSGVSGCGSGTLQLHFYAIDPGPTLTPFFNNGICLGGVGGGASLALEPRFHDEPGFPTRTGIAAGRAEAAGQAVLWIDLVGRRIGVDNITYDGPIEVPQFSPTGNAALVVSNNGGADTQWALVDLCANATGGIVSTGVPSGNVSAQIAGATGSFFAQVDTGGGTVDINIGDCMCGACCDNSTCTEEVFADQCVEFAPGSMCGPDACGSGGQTATLSVAVAGDGSGRVRSADGLVYCTSSCSTDFPTGSIVQLTALPFSGSYFDHWSGDCSGSNPTTVVQLSGDRTCTATFVIPTVDMAVMSAASTPNPFIAGQPGMLTIALAELDGVYPAAATYVRAVLPEGIDFDAATSDSRCRLLFDGETVECNIGTIPAGGFETLDIGVDIDPRLRGVATVPVEVTTFTQDTNGLNNAVTSTTAVQGIVDLSVTKTVSPNPVRPGEVVAYSLSITNAGPSAALDVDIDDVLPSGVTPVNSNGSPGGSGLCQLTELTAAGQTTVSYFATVDAGIADGAVLTNTVTVRTADTDPNLSNNTASADLTVSTSAPQFARQRRRILADAQTPLPNGLTPRSFLDPTIDGGVVAFWGLQTTSSVHTDPTGVLYYNGAQAVVADYTTTVPGASGTLRYADGFNNQGFTMVFAGLSNNGSFSPFGGIHASSGCGIRTLLKPGDPTPGIFGEFFSGANPHIANDRVFYWDNGEIFILELDTGGITVVGLRDTLMPEGDGLDFNGYGFTGADFDGEWVAFRGYGGEDPLPGGGSVPILTGIYAWHDGQFFKVVDQNDTTPLGGTYNGLDHIVAVEDGKIVFKNGASGAAPDELYIHDVATNTTTLIAATGLPMPGNSSRTVLSIASEFDIDDGRVIFGAVDDTYRGYGQFLWENGQIRRVSATLGNMSRHSLEGDQFVYTQVIPTVGYAVVLEEIGDPGDFDLDGDIDLDDFAVFSACLAGPQSAPPFASQIGPPDWWSCLAAFDHDVDNDLDLADFAALQALMTAL